MRNHFRNFAFFLTAISATAFASAGELIVSFVADTTEFSGPNAISPFNPDSQLGTAVGLNSDLIRADGQFIVKNFDPSVPGTQTFSFTARDGASDPGVEFFLHSPLLERMEAYTTRIGSNSPNSHSTNTKILLPRTASSTTSDKNTPKRTTTGFFGDGTLTVVDGVPTSLSYSQGRESVSSFDFILTPSYLTDLSISGNNFTLQGTYDLDTPGAADGAPYGFNSVLNGNPGSTILDTTRGEIQAELDAPFAGGGTGNLLDNKEASGGQPLSFNPLDGTGTLFHYSLGNAEVAVTAVPEPSSAILALGGSLLLLSMRRRMSA